MNKRYFVRIMVYAGWLIFCASGLSYANTAGTDNDENVQASLGALNNIVQGIDMNNLLPDQAVITENQPSLSDEQTLEVEVCEEIEAAPEIIQAYSDEQPAPGDLAENKPADEPGPFDFLKELSLFKEIYSSITELAGK